LAYTLSQCVTEVRSLINESTAGFWSDTEIENWIKEGTLDLSTKLLCFESEETISLVTDQWIYTSSDESWLGDLLKTKGCYYDDGTTVRGLQRIDIQKFGHVQNTTGNPTHFFENNRKFYISPTPTVTQNGNDITVICSSETDDITDLRDEHQTIVFLFATAKAKAKDRMFQESALYLTQYMNTINHERKDKYDYGSEPFSNFTLK